MFNDLTLWRRSAADSFPNQLCFRIEDAIPIDDRVDSGSSLTNPLQSFLPRFPRVAEPSPTEEAGAAVRVNP